MKYHWYEYRPLEQWEKVERNVWADIKLFMRVSGGSVCFFFLIVYILFLLGQLT